MRSIQADIAERKAQPEIRNTKRWSIAEAVMWLAITPLYIWAHNWVAVVLVAVILTKVYFIYNYRKLYLLMSNLTDEVLGTMNEWITEAQKPKKGVKRGSTNARTNRKK